MSSESKTNNNQSQQYKVNGLIFPSKDIFKMLKNLDEAFEFIVQKESDDCFDMPKVKVTETYPDACEELDGLFPNVIKYCVYKDIEYYNSAQKFFGRFKIIEYQSYITVLYKTFFVPLKTHLKK